VIVCIISKYLTHLVCYLFVCILHRVKPKHGTLSKRRW
jgi:hypothetical protein